MVLRVQRYPMSLFNNVFSLEREIDDLFGNFLGADVSHRVRRYPAIDLAEYEHGSVLVAELPGVKKEDVKISIEDQSLSIRGQRDPHALPEHSKWIRNEVETGEFNRIIELPHAVDADKVSAELENGILRIELPKPEEIRPRDIRIN